MDRAVDKRSNPAAPVPVPVSHQHDQHLRVRVVQCRLGGSGKSQCTSAKAECQRTSKVRNRTWVRKQEGLTLFLPTAALSVVLVIRLGVSSLTRRRKAHTCVIIPVSREHLKTHKRHNRKLTNLKGSPTKMISLAHHFRFFHCSDDCHGLPAWRVAHHPQISVRSVTRCTHKSSGGRVIA
jgi:hypothetical protein